MSDVIQEKIDILRNRLIDMQCAITGWHEGLSFDDENDLIIELDRQIKVALEESE